VEKAVSGGKRIGPRDARWMILLYLLGAVLMGLILGPTAVAAAWLLGGF
jgi:hypothetical protein